ncbi:helix-turn-helix domain-containing protein [Streptomyces sp. YGL11-2]|uniref:helix-turn-helix domain-containing protein n=1 Tax=Streptomyces sp. YGL11-2 TaxID=3414028 RepID=UPI003CFA6AB2
MLALAGRRVESFEGRLPDVLPLGLAEFIRELIVQGTSQGLDATRARGARLGRPPAMTDEQVRHARDLLTCPQNTVTSMAKRLGVSRNTIYKYVPELKGGRVVLAEATSTPELPRPTQPVE